MTIRNSIRLTTKIASPILHSLLIKRSRLVDLLRLGMKRKLSLVIAPAGYGKTTLLGEWLVSTTKEGWPVAWLTLDRDDNNAPRFWGYLADALVSVNPEWQFELPEMREISGDEINRQLLTSWINQIDANPMHFSLILDDYHTIQLEGIHKDISHFITHMPQQMHLVIASRIKPQFPIAELRVKNQLVEIGSADLTFSAGESETFFREVMGLDLALEEVAVLVHATEGWVAGLQMAALSIKHRPDANQWISRFSGSQGYIFDYLTESVLDVQDGAVQDFLLKTSVLTELSAPLCDYLLDKNDSRTRLDYLESINLFITPLNEERFWYRYHALFAEALKTRLERKYPQAIPELHLRAAAWLKENGFPEKAVPHAVSAGDLELAATIVEESILQVITRMDYATVRQWLSYLPDQYLWRRPEFWIYRSISEASLGNFNRVENMLSSMKTALGNADEIKLSAEGQSILRRDIAAVQAAVDILLGNTAQGISSAMQVIDALPDEEYFFYGWLNHTLGYAFEEADDLESAIIFLTKDIENSLKHNMPDPYVYTACEVSRIRKVQGRLHEAEHWLRQALDYAIKTSPQWGYPHFIKLVLADVLLEQNQVMLASDWVAEAVAYINQFDIHQLIWLGAIEIYTYLANYYLYIDTVEAKRYLQKARRELRGRHPFNFILSKFTDLQVRIWLAEGDFGAARGWVEKKIRRSGRGGKLSIAEHIGLGRIMLAQGEPERAVSFLQNAEAHARETDRGEQVLDALILESLAYHQLGQVDRSLQTLTQALALAEPEGYIRIFANEGAALKALLSRLLTQMNRQSKQTNILPSKQYIGKILLAFDRSLQISRVAGSQGSQKPDATSTLIKPLSDRELEILTYLRDKKSVKEIAVQLMVSYFTVKTHIRNIYHKLDVHNSKEAVDRAIRLNLLN